MWCNFLIQGETWWWQHCAMWWLFFSRDGNIEWQKSQIKSWPRDKNKLYVEIQLTAEAKMKKTISLCELGTFETFLFNGFVAL